MYRITNSLNELSIELTHKCTLHCVYCSSNSSLKKDKFLNFSKLAKIIKEVKNEFKINTVSLSGGESFLYPKFKELIDFLIDLNISIIIYTSGIIIDKKNNRSSLNDHIINYLSQYKDRISIILNIQGHNKELIEKINGVKNSFNLIEDSIDKLRKNNLSYEANIVPFKKNLKYLEEIIKFCIEKGFLKIHFLRFVPQGRGNDQKLILNKRQFKELTLKLISILENNQIQKKIEVRIGHPINFLFLFNKEHLFNLEKTHYCRGGFDAPLILPDGDVIMCPAWKNLKKFNAGNIYSQNFKEIWYSKNFKLFRNFVMEGYKKINEPCKSCKYIEECRGKCVAQRILCQEVNIEPKDLEELIYFSPDPNCFKYLLGDQ